MKKAAFAAILIISLLLNLYFIFRPKQMIIANATGWDGHYIEYDCLGKDLIYCSAGMGESLCREFYCIGLLTNERCYTLELQDGDEGRIVREDATCT